MLQRIRSKSRVAHLHKIYLSHCFVTNNDDGIVRKNQKSNISKTLEDFSTLSKLRLVSLVGFTTAAGYICANVPLDIQIFTSVCVGTGLCAGSAGTWNQIFEKNQDGLMKRTLNRPLPSERISVQTAKIFGTSVGFIGTLLLLWGTNPVVAALGLGNIILYIGPYTFSKKYTELNTWIGSVVGAIPPVMGYAAATGGSILAVEPVVLSTLLFLWQFPHFFALSWMYRDDYARGGFQMVSCNDITGMRTASLIREYSFYLTALPILTSVMGYTSYMFAFEGTTANLYLLYRVYKFQEDRSNANARKIFLCSLWYLPVLLIGYIFHRKASDIEVIDNLEVNELQILEGSKSLPLPQLLLKVKYYLKGICVHEIIVDHNKEKIQSNDITSPADSIPTNNILNSTKISDSTMNMETPSQSSHHSSSNAFKEVVLNVPGIQTLSANLCPKKQSDQTVQNAVDYTSNQTTNITEVLSSDNTTNDSMKQQP